jgi:hypothetical protein
MDDQRHAPVALSLGKTPGDYCTFMGSRSGLDGSAKSRLLWYLIPGPSSPEGVYGPTQLSRPPGNDRNCWECGKDEESFENVKFRGQDDGRVTEYRQNNGETNFSRKFWQGETYGKVVPKKHSENQKLIIKQVLFRNLVDCMKILGTSPSHAAKRGLSSATREQCVNPSNAKLMF